MVVIPANAGVILLSANFPESANCYPRECGGDPEFAQPKHEQN